MFLCTSTLIYEIYYVCGGTDLNAAQIFLTYGVFTIIVSPIMDKIALRVNNKKALVIGMGVQGLLLIAFGVFLPLTVVTMNIMMFVLRSVWRPTTFCHILWYMKLLMWLL